MTLYTDFASFDAAVDITQTATISNPVTDPYAEGSITVVSSGPFVDFGDNLFGTGPYIYAATGLNPVVFNFASPVTAFGFNIHGGSTLIVGSPALAAYSTTGLSFVGVLSDTPFTTARLSAGEVAFDNLSIGHAASVSGVPEPAGWALLISGFCAAGARLRWRRTRSA